VTKEALDSIHSKHVPSSPLGKFLPKTKDNEIKTGSLIRLLVILFWAGRVSFSNPGI